MNDFNAMLASAGGREPLGTWIMSGSPLVAEAIGHAGFDWAVVDMEHSPLDMMEVVHILQALSATKLIPVVRVPWNDSVMVKRVLDAGARTVLFPFVQSADEARRAVAATRYPPQGHRGIAAMSRASRFGTTPNYIASANEHIGVIVQLESLEAVANLESIATVPGVDALFIGPADLSADMGHVGDLLHPEVLDATSDAIRRAKAMGVPVGTLGGTTGTVSKYLAMGFDYVAMGSDLGLLMGTVKASISAVRAASGSEGSQR